MDGDGSAQRCTGGAAAQGVARQVGAGLGIGHGRQFAQGGRRALAGLAEEGGGGAAAGHVQFLFGQVDLGFARAIARQRDHRLAGGDHLAHIGRHGQHHAIHVGLQYGVIALVFGFAGAGGFGAGLGHGGVGGGLGLFIGLGGDGAMFQQLAQARFLGHGLHLARLGGFDRRTGGRQGQIVIDGIDAHQGLATADGLAGVDQAFDDLAGYPESQVAFGAGVDHAGKADALAAGRLHGDPGHLGHGVRRRRWMAASGQGEQERGADDGAPGQAREQGVHGSLGERSER